MVPDTMISCGALTKRSGHFTAVDRVSFSVAWGSLVGFLANWQSGGLRSCAGFDAKAASWV